MLEPGWGYIYELLLDIVTLAVDFFECEEVRSYVSTSDLVGSFPWIYWRFPTLTPKRATFQDRRDKHIHNVVDMLDIGREQKVLASRDASAAADAGASPPGNLVRRWEIRPFLRSVMT